MTGARLGGSDSGCVRVCESVPARALRATGIVSVRLYVNLLTNGEGQGWGGQATQSRAEPALGGAGNPGDLRRGANEGPLP